jgi:hypothetical protein
MRLRAEGSAALLVLGAVALALLWLIELTDDPTDGAAFYALLFGAPLLIAVALVLVAWRDELATRVARSGAVLTLLGALVPDVVGLLAAVVGLALVFAGVRERAHGLRPGLALSIVGVLGLLVRLESGDGLLLFLPVLVLGALALAVARARIAV